MRHRAILSALAAGAFIGTALSVAAVPAQADHGGFHVSGSTLLDGNGNPFVVRGTSVPHVWFPLNFGQFADVAGLGANSVRVVLGSGDRWGPNSTATYLSWNETLAPNGGLTTIGFNGRWSGSYVRRELTGSRSGHTGVRPR